MGVYSLKLLAEDLRFCLQEKCRLSLEDKITDKDSVINELVKHIESKLDLTNQIENVIEYVKEQQILYIKDYDYICLIIDRDKGNVKPNQYSKIIEICKQKGIRLFVSNPTFEFWLLLHSNKVFEYDPKDLLRNRKNGNRRFLETVLSQVFNGYRKEYIKVEHFMTYIQLAIENEKKYCEDIVDLQEKLGSNVGELMEEIILLN